MTFKLWRSNLNKCAKTMKATSASQLEAPLVQGMRQMSSAMYIGCGFSAGSLGGLVCSSFGEL